MSKYIDADLLMEKISEQMESIPREVGRGAGTITSKGYGMMEAFQIVRSIIDSLKQEQPSLPDNLDEASEEYANTHYGEFFEVEYEFGDPIETIVDDKPFVRDAFKSGAEWMAGQGVSMLGKVGIYGVDVESITKELREGGFKIGEEVILQIRKKQ